MMTRKLLLPLLFMLLGMLTGCRTLLLSEPEHDDQLPWNTPAGWEDTVIGVPY